MTMVDQQLVVLADSQLPTLTHGAGMILGVCIIALVAAAALSVFMLVMKAMGKSQVFGKSIDFSFLMRPLVGAIILGSASGAVYWGSGLYTIAQVDQPPKIQAAYDSVKSKAEPVSFSPDEDPERTKSVLGSQYDTAAGENKLTEKDPTYGSTQVKYVPSGDDKNKPDPCYKVAVSYFELKGDSSGRGSIVGGKVETQWHWYNPDGQCSSGDPQQF